MFESLTDILKMDFKPLGINHYLAARTPYLILRTHLRAADRRHGNVMINNLNIFLNTYSR